MRTSRRDFLKTMTLGAAGAACPLAALGRDEQRLVLLHTNDTHSRIDPFPLDGGRLQGLGGVARRASLVERVRAEHPHVLLLDSGDIFQGTPYFNFFDGELEFKAMSAMRYDAATLGNHDFDNGTDGLERMLPFADFPFVCANYAIDPDRPLADRVSPSLVRTFGPLRVGIFGLGISFDRLVLPELHRGVRYLDPVEQAREVVEALRADGCGYVVCLSHLGYRYRDRRVSDVDVAKQVPGIDLILGGHTHTFMPEPEVVVHPSGWRTAIHQVGWGGVRVGRIDVTFDAAGQPGSWMSARYDLDAAYDHA